MTMEEPRRPRPHAPVGKILWYVLGAGIALALVVALAIIMRSPEPAKTPGGPSGPSVPSGPPVETTAKTPRVPPGPPAPAGFRAKAGTTAEPYTGKGWAREIVHEKTGMEMIFIPAGEFMMGARPADNNHLDTASPIHRVRITKPFYLGKYEVTRGQFAVFANETHYVTDAEDEGWAYGFGDRRSGFSWRKPGYAQTDNHPVVCVSYDDAGVFCEWLSAQTGNSAGLPTEAQWEYACRAGSAALYCFGDDDARLVQYAWYDPHEEEKPHKVGLKKPNAWGLYDMHGNVAEWCRDWYRPDYYAASPQDDPPGPESGQGRYRVSRGGWCGVDPWVCRSGYRLYYGPGERHVVFGFRLSMELTRAETGPASQKTAPPPAAPREGSALRVPPGFKAKDGTAPEPYSRTGWAREIVHEKTGMEMAFIPAGQFKMGSPPEENGREHQEGPMHRVRITTPFYIGKYEVTQGEWKKVTGRNPSRFKGSDRLPVETVSWNDGRVFLKKAGDGLRFPTEAEWEYACRAGSRGRFCFGDDDGGLGDYAWCEGDSGKTTHEVGQKKPNAWGLHDMHGNVWEWCADWYGKSAYEEHPLQDPQGPKEGETRVLRGGALWNRPPTCRSASRTDCRPDFGNGAFGLRLALDIK